MANGMKVNWDLFTEVEDLAVNLDMMFSKIGDPDPITGCQFQTKGGKHRQGYMMIWAHDRDKIGDPQPGIRKMVTAHRVLARLKFKQPLDPSTKVWHICGNPLCLNRDHLALGTQGDVNTNSRKFNPNMGRRIKAK